jgi:transcription elongation factor Elf1
MRRMLRRIKAQFQNAGNCPFCGEVDFNVTVGGKRQAAFGEHAKDCPYDDLMKMKLER